MGGFVCGVCGAERASREVTVVERLLGRGERFRYRECAACGCLQASDPPTDPAPYYNNCYFSRIAGEWRSAAGPVRAVRLVLARAMLGDGPVARVLQRVLGNTVLASVARAGARPGMTILDVGCGEGGVLATLRDLGFTRLTGIDPRAPVVASKAGGVCLVRGDPASYEPSERFDLIMLHHVLEHVADGVDLLTRVKRWLAPGGRLLVRLPLADSRAWRVFREDWLQIDAPRHLFLHTERSFRLLSRRAGLQIVAAWRDSTSHQVLDSRWYRQGGTGHWVPSGMLDRLVRPVLPGLRAWLLNRTGRGDQGCFLVTAGGMGTRNGPDRPLSPRTAEGHESPTKTA